ncbi:unnamed protein product [Blepharisma stoltei]|uniref:Uncharacterized protein n=1 Tax=Blepharisma stoltei TaxID=1481888 RepID=A0AAU9J6S4_9CILI|nr:unnamed protein product [Blepharisma stoltei]
MKSGKELFIETRDKLIQARLILESSIETPTIKYLSEGEEKVYDLSTYIEDYFTLLHNVPTYVSDDSYVLKYVPNIKELITNLRESFKSPENSSAIDIEHNVEVQMLSKIFSEEWANKRLIKYIYYQAFTEWLKEIGFNYFKYLVPWLPNEDRVLHDARIIGIAIYEALNQEAQHEETPILGDDIIQEDMI